MATLLVEALKGAQAEVAAQQGLIEKLRQAGKLSGILAQELRLAVSLSPFGVRAVRIRSALPTAATTEAAAAPADALPFGVVLHPAVPYGPLLRHKADIYVPVTVHQQRQHQQRQHQQRQHQQRQQQPQCQQQQECELGPLPVVFFVHGGIWVTGERWHFCPMATRLAQAGLLVVVPSYTLYPDALAGQMAAEVLAAYKWTAAHVAAYGGDPSQITVMGHSAGGHLGSLALLMLAQQKHAAAAATQQMQVQVQVQVQVQAARVPQVCLLPPAGVSSSSGSNSSRDGSNGSSSSRRPHLPDEQLRQRDELAAAEAAHHHTIHPDQDPVLHPPQQQPPQHQGQQQQGPHWTAAGVLCVPTPLAFIGMSSIYDVARHFEFESLRGVAGISTMGRACGGAVNFDSVSPVVVLRRATASAGAAAATAAGGDKQVESSSGIGMLRGTGVQQPVGQFLVSKQQQTDSSQVQAAAAAGPILAGEVIPFRSGLEGRQPAQQPAAVSDGSVGHQSQQQQQQQGAVLETSSSSSSSSSSAAVVECPTSALLAAFSVAAAQHMPPCILMSSLGDHMVPWHEAAEMFLALRACNIPAKHLIYDRPQHNDFVLDWNPLRSRRRTAAASDNGAGQQGQQAGTGGGGEEAASLPAFARDLLAILSRQVEVRFETGSSAQAAATVAALERAAGLPQLHQGGAAPRPLSRL